MLCYILTYGRADRQITWEKIPERWRKRTFFVVHPSEKDLFSWHPNVLVSEQRGAPAARQAIIDHGREQHVWIFDDDLRLCNRVRDWHYTKNNRLEQSHPEYVGRWLDIFEKLLLHRYAHCAMDQRFGNSSIRHRWRRMNSRIMRSFGVDCAVLKEEGIRFDKFLFWEDFHVALSLYRRGYPAYVSVDMVNDAITNAAGGVQDYRKVEALLEVRSRFIAEHSPWVEAVDKSSASWGGNVGDTMPDVRIQWLKAYNARDLAGVHSETSTEEPPEGGVLQDHPGGAPSG